MKKVNFILPIMGVSMVLSITSCSHKYPMYSPEELSLQSLTRITDNEDNKFRTPFGGDNGKELFFAVRDKSGNRNIYRKENPISNAMSPKTNGKNSNMSPTYSAITNQVAFAGCQEGAYLNDLFMMDASQGSAIRRVTNTPNEEESYPCLSTDGQTIVYQRRFVGGTDKEAQIWRQNLQTESPTLLCHGLMPSFSHDGSAIVFVRFTPDGENKCLVIMNTDGQNQTELTDAKLGEVSNPRFSPDDKQIVFQCKKKDKRDNDLYVINRDGTGLTQLTFNKSFDAEPYWSNDGHIYFSSDRGSRKDNFQIWRFKYGSYTPTIIKGPGTSVTTPNPANTVYHTVSQGETITNIAQKYNVTVREIVQWNGLTTMTLQPGTKLRVSAQ